MSQIPTANEMSPTARATPGSCSGTVDCRRGQARRGNGVDAFGILAVAVRDRRIGAHDRVGGREAARTGRAQRARQEQSGGVRHRDREEDRQKGAGERGAASAQGLPGDAEHVTPPVR